ncbi:MAG: putative metal-binding motif-containing protein [Patescibacteria group bacterium]|jgi:hypothetical protein
MTVTIEFAGGFPATEAIMDTSSVFKAVMRFATMSFVLLAACGTKDGLPSGATRINNEAEMRTCANEQRLLAGQDLDRDGVGGPIQWCLDPLAVVPHLSTSTGDCNDENPAVFPGAVEIANKIDDDCDGLVDDSSITSVMDCKSNLDGDNYASTLGVMHSEDLDCLDAGEAPASTQGGDCDDTQAGIYPFAPETCNGKDDGCDDIIDNALGYTDFHADKDADSFGSATDIVNSCAQPANYVNNQNGVDCDDAHASAHPGGTEVCDALDNNCNGTADEGLGCNAFYFTDADKDSYGNPVTAHTIAVAGDVTNGLDCDDANVLRNPGKVEVQGNGLDDDCDDGTSDNPGKFCRDFDNDGVGDELYGTRTTAQAGYVASCDDCRDDLNPVHPGAIEVIGDEVDNDCNPVTKDTVTTGTYYADKDGDTYGDKSVVVTVATPGYVVDSTDCNDNDKTAHPGATEVVGDGVDQDCSGFEVCFLDNDSDKFRDTSGQLYNSNDLDCVDTREAGIGVPTTDCDDNDPTINPNVTEVIGDQKDQNCDGKEVCYLDIDQDGFRFIGSPNDTYDSNTDVDCLDKFEASAATPATDCAEIDKNIHPGAMEIPADGIDQNCDGKEVCWRDVDDDDYRKDTTSTIDSSDMDCVDTQEAVATTVDCNDKNDTVHPNATETCNSVDDNCDGKVDENATGTTWYADTDKDGYGNGSVTAVGCTAPTGFVSDKTDCDDAHALSYPGKVEVCDALDNNCDGLVDNGLTCSNNPPPPQGICPTGQRRYTGTFQVGSAIEGPNILDVYGSVTGGGVNEFPAGSWTNVARFHVTRRGGTATFTDESCVADGATVLFSVYLKDRNGQDHWSAEGGRNGCSVTGDTMALANSATLAHAWIPTTPVWNGYTDIREGCNIKWPF